jgi:hypothetical protein
MTVARVIGRGLLVMLVTGWRRRSGGLRAGAITRVAEVEHLRHDCQNQHKEAPDSDNLTPAPCR